MTDQQGTTLPAFKNAVTTALLARLPNAVTYDSPTSAADSLGTDGAGIGLWWLDDASADIEVNVMTGGPQWFDETVSVTIVVQVLGLTTDDTQYVVDLRASNALGHLKAVLASDPTVGLALSAADYRNAYATPQSWTYSTGVDGQNMRGGRFEVTLEFKSRLTLEAS